MFLNSEKNNPRSQEPTHQVTQNTMPPNTPQSVADLVRDLGMLSTSPVPDRTASPLGQSSASRRIQTDRLANAGAFAEAFDLELVQLRTSLDRYGEDDERTMDSLDNLSSLSFKLGRREEADRLLDRVIILRTKTQGEAHPDTLGALASKVASLQMAGHIDQAEQMGSDLLVKCTNSLGVEDAATLRVMANLATIYRTKGDLSNAEILSHVVLETRQKVLPPDDVDTVTAMVNLAGVYFSQHRWADAAALLQSVLTIRRRIFGDAHDMTIKIMKLLDKAYEELERWNDLLRLRQLRLDVTKRKLGEGHMGTVEAKMNLMHAYERLQAWESAREIVDGVINSLENMIPADHPIVQSMQQHKEALEARSSKDKHDAKHTLRPVYNPLDNTRREIRLVSVKQGLPKDPLECELIVVALEATPPFEALPYVWGPMNENKELSLQGCRMKITDNLWGALIQLRSATASRLLWVDALAINQTDLQERSDQVRLMRDMYTKATSTLVWLGEERDHSQMAMSFLKRLEERGSQTEVISRVLRNGFEDPLFLAIECLYTQREYWTRLWVVQEIICSKTASVHCGTDSVRFETLRDFHVPFAEALVEIGSTDLQESFKSFESFIHKIVLRGPAKVGRPSSSGMIERKPLLNLLNTYRNANCTDPRDRIYALLGISLQSESSHPGLQIDYSRATAEVYRAAAQAIIEESGKLSVICLTYQEVADPRSGHYHARHHPLPSWTPDWSTISGSLPLASILTNAKASGDLQARTVFFPSGSQITVEGVCITNIIFFTESLSMKTTHHRDILRTLMGWRVYVQACLGIRPGDPSDERLDPFYRLLMLDIPAYAYIIPTHRQWWSSWERALLEKGSTAEIDFTPLQKTYLQHIFDYCSERCMIALNDPLSNEGTKLVGSIQLGLCPQGVRQDDVLVVLWGCDFPVILRAQNDHYVFIGEALVPAYMNEEAIKQESRGELVVQKFEIH